MSKEQFANRYAIDPAWGNTMENVIHGYFPRPAIEYRGIVEPQGRDNSGNPFGGGGIEMIIISPQTTIMAPDVKQW